MRKTTPKTHTMPQSVQRRRRSQDRMYEPAELSELSLQTQMLARNPKLLQAHKSHRISQSFMKSRMNSKPLPPLSQLRSHLHRMTELKSKSILKLHLHSIMELKSALLQYITNMSSISHHLASMISSTTRTSLPKNGTETAQTSPQNSYYLMAPLIRAFTIFQRSFNLRP